MYAISVHCGGTSAVHKLAAVSAAIRQHHEELIIHTGQHYDYTLEQYGITRQSHVRRIEAFIFTDVVLGRM